MHYPLTTLDAEEALGTVEGKYFEIAFAGENHVASSSVQNCSVREYLECDVHRVEMIGSGLKLAMFDEISVRNPDSIDVFQPVQVNSIA